MSFTKGGLKCIEQAKAIGLCDYYDAYMGTYLIPLYNFNNDVKIREKVLNLLTNGKCYKADGSIDKMRRLAMEIVNHINEEGQIEAIIYDVYIHDIEPF